MNLLRLSKRREYSRIKMERKTMNWVFRGIAALTATTLAILGYNALPKDTIKSKPPKIDEKRLVTNDGIKFLKARITHTPKSNEENVSLLGEDTENPFAIYTLRQGLGGLHYTRTTGERQETGELEEITKALEGDLVLGISDSLGTSDGKSIILGGETATTEENHYVIQLLKLEYENGRPSVVDKTEIFRRPSSDPGQYGVLGFINEDTYNELEKLSEEEGTEGFRFEDLPESLREEWSQIKGRRIPKEIQERVNYRNNLQETGELYVPRGDYGDQRRFLTTEAGDVYYVRPEEESTEPAKTSDNYGILVKDRKSGDYYIQRIEYEGGEDGKE
jgi:hypothetical protein